ncbi:2-amino-4-hydroxy-6-hydroxymethyldihydropteridine diphosphokinase [Anaerotalea alkaliphila]|uniref:Bifunctional folate synthesis protein n=1 Tax=Anaerotalea alkaliphila TaxID=2662126 RepID=A0A7X5HTU2_9FIRM|nr:2-amino-4-hydroxy-6-hydroxymethyldihydropteridine diphosphokinase [Anaerotalea alkaliphila]NDL66548.1 2-amino-4-hydroxy-6-hydroxymethyldihydropteridine diphosphokinase [Anaerotalea alkaliphila]
MEDRIIIKGLEVFAFHGVLPEETSMGQKFILDMEVFLDLQSAGLTDRLEGTLHYGHLSREALEAFRKDTCQLIEAAAENVCHALLEGHPQIREILLTVKKPRAPIHLHLEYPAVQVRRKWHRAYVALGSNLGDREETIRQALERMGKERGIRLGRCSTLVETEPVGYLEQGPFINGVVELRTLLEPAVLLEKLQEMENALHRERIIRWGPRTIDLDILLYDDLVLEGGDLIVPHPRMLERGFVMEPLKEIAPYVLHPLERKRIGDLWP